MNSAAMALFGSTLLIAALLTAIVRRMALNHGVLDVPNERSSHTHATPRGGGVAVVVTTTAGVLVLAARGAMPRELWMALVGGGLLVAIVGFLDDRFALPARVRLAVHLSAAVWAVYWLGGLTEVRIGHAVVALAWSGRVLAVLGIAWVLNLFNFMDGIDGIAASEALFVTSAGVLLCATGAGLVSAGGLFAGACAGFLIWNWPPAKIFLGDTGSGYIGYTIAVLALAAARADPVAIWVWFILGSAFFADATITLLRRVLRGERAHEAHRIHAYQWLSRRWRSHARVTLAVAAVNLGWLLPCAWAASRHASDALVWVCVALIPLVALSTAAGSGRPEFPPVS